MEKKEGHLYYLFGGIVLACAVVGFIVEGVGTVLGRFLLIQTHPARLLNDFSVIGSPGAALFNAALVGAIGLALTAVSRIRLSGPTVAAVFTLMGFGLFGKTPLNILPIMFGVFLSAKAVGKTFREYILIALFGSALGPLVTFVVIEAGLSGIPAILTGTGVGMVAGFLLPSLAISMLRLHQGFNLYNIGLTAGFFAIFVAAVFAAAGRDLSLDLIWNRQPSPLLIWLIPAISVPIILFGIFSNGKNIFISWYKIQKQSGRLPSDFMDMVSSGGALLNMGLMGLFCWGYIRLIGGDLNGPVLGGILTVMGFSAFGKHMRNSLPIMAGVVVATLIFGKNLSAPGPLLAFLFCTTLAPIAGDFGMPAGFIAGFLHLVLVERTAPWHGGMDLYNNGFAGGLTATLMVAVIEWFKANKNDNTWFGKQPGTARKKRGKI